MTDTPEKSNVQLVIDALLTGQPMRSRDIAEWISKTQKKEIKTRNVSSVLSRLINPDQCDLAHFIGRTREGNVFTYAMVADALQLRQDQAYGLTLKEGEESYPLARALSDYPALRKYVDAEAPEAAPAPGPDRAPETEQETPSAAEGSVFDAVSFQESMMTMYIDSLTLILDQAEALTESMLNQCPWVSGEVKKGLSDSVGLCRETCQLLKKAAAFSFDEMKAFMNRESAGR